MSQSTTRVGSVRVLAGEALTGKEGYLVKMTHDTGVPEVKLPAAITDHGLYVVIEGGADAALVSVMPIEAGRNARLKLKGACNPGDVLVLAAIAGSDAGMVRVLPTTTGTYRGVAVAEELGVDTQLVLSRPASLGNFVVA